MASHVKALGVLHILFSGLSLIGGLIALTVFGGIATLVGFAAHDPDKGIAMAILGGIGGLVFVICLVLSLPGLVVGIGLLNMASWAKICGLLLSALELFNVPFGTALGLYGLWVLTHAETDRLFHSVPASASRA